MKYIIKHIKNKENIIYQNAEILEFLLLIELFSMSDSFSKLFIGEYSFIFLDLPTLNFNF